MVASSSKDSRGLVNVSLNAMNASALDKPKLGVINSVVLRLRGGADSRSATWCQYDAYICTVKEREGGVTRNTKHDR